VRLPSHLTASGPALLAALPREHVRALFPDASAFTRRGVMTQTHAELRAELVRTRARGYAVEDARSPPGSRRWRLNRRNRPAADIAHLK
jgi:DNA-binding IclR family transcriptional regulator